MRWPWKARGGAGSKVQAEFDTYQVHLGMLATGDAGRPFADSPIRPLYQGGELERDIAELRRMLAADESSETKAAPAQGVEPARVQRYKTRHGRYHAVYVIDTRDLAESRRRIDYPEYLRHALDLRFKAGVS